MTPLAKFVHKQREEKPILAMTHVIYGYPSVEESIECMAELLAAGVDLLEVQFPFSDPVADGPAIVHACHKALEQPLTVANCLNTLGQLQADYPASRILLMSYLNPMYRFGLEHLVDQAAANHIAGLIIPDLPYEQAHSYTAHCQQQNIEPIWLVTPATPKERLGFLASKSDGLLYCVSRSGVTGQTTKSEHSLKDYLAEIGAHTETPLAVGFGIRAPEQVQELIGLADIAIVGSALLEAFNRGGKTEVVKTYKALFDQQ